jgi:hypothetical protein
MCVSVVCVCDVCEHCMGWFATSTSSARSTFDLASTMTSRNGTASAATAVEPLPSLSPPSTVANTGSSTIVA